MFNIHIINKMKPAEVYMCQVYYVIIVSGNYVPS